MSFAVAVLVIVAHLQLFYSKERNMPLVMEETADLFNTTTFYILTAIKLLFLNSL